MPRLTLPTVCAVQKRLWHATPDVVRPYVLPKGNDGMTRSMSLDRLCCPRAMMAYHARRWPPSVLSKGDDGMPRPTSSDRLCSPKAMIAYHA